MVAGALALCLYGIAVTETLSAVAAITAASALLWLRLVPGRRTMVALVAVALLAAATVAALPALRTRVVARRRSSSTATSTWPSPDGSTAGGRRGGC